jgi:hypothetical protein
MLSGLCSYIYGSEQLSKGLLEKETRAEVMVGVVAAGDDVSPPRHASARRGSYPRLSIGRHVELFKRSSRVFAGSTSGYLEAPSSFIKKEIGAKKHQHVLMHSLYNYCNNTTAG